MEVATLILQSFTVLFAVVTLIQTARIQKGQNIISITTTSRLNRINELKEYSHSIISNTAPELLVLDKGKAIDMVKTAYDNATQFFALLHRNFIKDLELMYIAEQVCAICKDYIDILYNKASEDEDIVPRLEAYRKLFVIKCDMYSNADWQRIKKETGGINTKATEWKVIYEDQMPGYRIEYDELMRDKGYLLSDYTIWMAEQESKEKEKKQLFKDYKEEKKVRVKAAKKAARQERKADRQAKRAARKAKK